MDNVSHRIYKFYLRCLNKVRHRPKTQQTRVSLGAARHRGHSRRPHILPSIRDRCSRHGCGATPHGLQPEPSPAFVDAQYFGVAISKLLVSDAVQDAVDAGVDVRDHDDVEMYLLRVLIVPVQDDDEDVRRPARGEDDKDYKEGSCQLHGLRLAFGAQAGLGTAIGVSDGRHALLAVLDVLEDLPVADGYADQRE